MGPIPQHGNSIQVLDRAVRILDVVSQNDGATLSVIAGAVKLPLSTVSRILDALGYHALIERDERGRTYRLGRRLLALSAAVPQQASDLVFLARGILERLSAASGEDGGLSRLHGTHAVIVDRVDGPNPLKIIDVLGKPQPLYCGAFRKVLLAYQDSEWIERYLASLKLVRFTPKTLRSKPAIREELDRIRRQGYATSLGEVLPDAAGVAAPIFGVRGDLQGSIFLVVPASRFAKERVAQLAGLVVEAARELSSKLRGENHAQVAPLRRAPARSRQTTRRLKQAERV